MSLSILKEIKLVTTFNYGKRFLRQRLINREEEPLRVRAVRDLVCCICSSSQLSVPFTSLLLSLIINITKNECMIIRECFIFLKNHKFL